MATNANNPDTSNISDQELIEEIFDRDLEKEVMDRLDDHDIHDEHYDRNLRERYYDDDPQYNEEHDKVMEVINHGYQNIYRGIKTPEQVAKDILYEVLGVVV